MGIENFLKRWTIRESDTTVIAAGDQLHIGRVGNSPKVKFRCDSTNPDTVEIWNDVTDCKWSENGGPAGHLEGTISDSSGESYPLVFTYAEGSPSRIHVAVVAMPAREGGITAQASGGGAGSAAGDDDL